MIPHNMILFESWNNLHLLSLSPLSEYCKKYCNYFDSVESRNTNQRENNTLGVLSILHSLVLLLYFRWLFFKEEENKVKIEICQGIIEKTRKNETI